jgi:hypothetical protein
MKNPGDPVHDCQLLSQDFGPQSKFLKLWTPRRVSVWLEREIRIITS